jgi:protoporphyrinogen oxidase
MTGTPARERWGIVGGGFLGLTLAHRIAQAGHAVTLYEGASQLGGLASAWTLGDVVWDRHYHVTLLSDRHLRALLAELGLEAAMQWRQTRTGFYVGGRLHSMSDAVEFLRFPALGLVDKLRLAVTILHASRVRDWKRLERLRAIDWLTRWSGRRTVEKIWAPLLRAKLGDSHERVSAAFIWATIARLYAARRTGLKREMFGYVPGGYARVLARFAEVLAAEGVVARLGQRVRRVEPAVSGGRVGVELEGGGVEAFDRVVVAMPAPAAARVCTGLSAGERARLEAIEYQGILCGSLLLDRPLDRFYVTNVTEPGLPFTGVIEMSALVDPAEFGGRALVYVPRYVSADSPEFERSDAEVVAAFVGGLARMYPHFHAGQVRAFRLSRVRHVFALPTLGYSDRLPPLVTSRPGLYVVSSAHIVNGTLNVNETVQLAERAAGQFLADVPAAAGDRRPAVPRWDTVAAP